LIDQKYSNGYNVVTVNNQEQMMEYTPEQIERIVAEAKQAAYLAADRFFKEQLNGQDQMACGFAWVNIHGVKGNTKLGKTLKAAGVRQDYTRAFCIWNPAEYGCQNVDTLYEGARAAAAVLKQHGFDASAGSRLD
jgi:hypothetical protein